MTTVPVSVVIPSRLQRDSAGDLLVLRAVQSIMKGTVLPTEILIGLDKDVRIDTPDVNKLRNACYVGDEYKVRIAAVSWEGQGHQGATNGAAQHSKCKYLAMLEDDDEWHAKRLEATLEAVEKCGAHFVSCSQQEVFPDGTNAGKNDFPTASGYLMAMDTWRAIGGFDEEYKIHHDNALLGKINARKLKRIHLVEEGCKRSERDWLNTVEQFARVMNVPGLRECLVVRHRNPEGIMANTAKDEARKKQSEKEYMALELLYSGIPW